MKQEKQSPKQERLEEIVVALPTKDYFISKIPIIGNSYLKILERRYQKLFPEYQFIFK